MTSPGLAITASITTPVLLFLICMVYGLKSDVVGKDGRHIALLDLPSTSSMPHYEVSITLHSEHLRNPSLVLLHASPHPLLRSHQPLPQQWSQRSSSRNPSTGLTLK